MLTFHYNVTPTCCPHSAQTNQVMTEIKQGTYTVFVHSVQTIICPHFRTYSGNSRLHLSDEGPFYLHLLKSCCFFTLNAIFCFMWHVDVFLFFTLILYAILFSQTLFTCFKNMYLSFLLLTDNDHVIALTIQDELNNYDLQH